MIFSKGGEEMFKSVGNATYVHFDEKKTVLAVSMLCQQEKTAASEGIAGG